MTDVHLAGSNSAANAAGEQSHPLRGLLNQELHARPFLSVEAPARVLHIALLETADGEPTGHTMLVELCRLWNVPMPPADSAHFSAQADGVRLKWERHTEFTTFTLSCEGPFDTPFDNRLLQRVPMPWWKRLRGRVLVAAQVAIGTGPVEGDPVAAMSRHFSGVPVAGSRVLGDGAMAWSDFRIYPDGFSRYLLWDTNLREQQAGRLVQRILEIEAYSMMALLALPMARRAVADVAAAEAGTAQVTERMLHAPHGEIEHELLPNLTELAARVERLIAAGSYRFNATRAYHAIVESRIAELRESRIEGVPTIGEFMERRLAPAMQFCRSIAAQQSDLSQRVMRATELLRTRVDVSLERQNRDLLHSMDRRTQLQLRLQETVEGLSTIVLSYYLVGLLGQFAEWLGDAVLHRDLHSAKGMLVLPTVLVVWVAGRSLRRKLMRREAGHPHPA
ncbi:DUF3422 family protein [Azospirillum sp. sgz302134]